MDMEQLIELKLAGESEVLETHPRVALSAKYSTLFDLASKLVLRLSHASSVILCIQLKIQTSSCLFVCELNSPRLRYEVSRSEREIHTRSAKQGNL